mmetsp:Transcript_94021/g.181379  ORF Transcript_94021/g.181379 Transcript_94021/m.181379 type:complete len:726 (+) Transcript_94021:99-2276(+)
MEVNIGSTPAEGKDNSRGFGVESDVAKGISWLAEEDEGTEDHDLQEKLQRLLANSSEVVGDLADAAQEGAGEAPPPDPKGVDEDPAPELAVAAEPEEAPSWTPVVPDNWATNLASATEDAAVTPELDPLGCADDSDDTEPPDEDEEQTSSTSSDEADDYDAMEVLPDPSLVAEGQAEAYGTGVQVPPNEASAAEELPTDSVERHGSQPQLQQQQQQLTPQPVLQPTLQPTLQSTLQHTMLEGSQPELQQTLSNGVQQQPLVQSQLSSNNELPFRPNLQEQNEQVDLHADETLDLTNAGAEQLALPVDVGPDPALAEASSRAARRKAAAALPSELTPRLLCLRDLASTSLEEIGVTYTEFVERLAGRALAAGRSLVPRNRVSFQVSGSFTSKTLGKVSVPVTLRRSRPTPRTPPLPESGAPTAPEQIVVLDDVEEEDDAPQSPQEPEEEADPSDPYENPAAPLALLRAYSIQGRWTGIRNGFIVFEDDRVQYPTATLTPVREQEDGGALLSLSSLWLLAAMGERYKDAASNKILQDHGAVRIAARHVPHLLQFLVGSAKECRLLVAPEKLTSIPAPVAMRLAPLRKCLSARPPLSSLELRHLPERERDEVTAQRLVETLRSTAQMQLAIRQLEVEEAALSGLLRDLQARLEATDAEVAGARRRRRESHEEFREELQLTRSYASNKRRRGTNGDAARNGANVEDPVARLLESLDVASSQPAALSPVE